MPITYLQADHQEQWALWHIEETEEDFAHEVNEPVPAEIINTHKRLEWLAARALIKILSENAGVDFRGIRKDEFGKPHLTDYDLFISLSHSYPYVAAQISTKHSVGIDVEQPKEKLLKVAPRILSTDELADAGNDIIKHCIYWSAKETLYKIYGKGGLHFNSQLNLQPFTRQPSGILTGTIKSNSEKQSVTLGYQVHTDFVVVFTQTN